MAFVMGIYKNWERLLNAEEEKVEGIAYLLLGAFANVNRFESKAQPINALVVRRKFLSGDLKFPRPLLKDIAKKFNEAVPLGAFPQEAVCHSPDGENFTFTLEFFAL